MHIRPYIGTLCGIAVGVLAIVIWVITFQPEGGPELSSYLFPTSKLILEPIYPTQSIPASVWYGVAFLQWLVLGIIIDLLRRVFRKKSGRTNVR